MRGATCLVFLSLVPALALLSARPVLADSAHYEEGAGPDFVHAFQGKSAASRNEPASVEQTLSTQAVGEPTLFEAIANLFTPDPFSSTETVCTEAGPLTDVGSFTGIGPFTPELAARPIKSTVRISLKSPQDVEIAMREEGIKRYTLGVMQKLWSKPPAGFGGGFCTGTLLLSNIVLSAGHCIAHEDYTAKNLKPPAVLNADGSHRRYFTKEEFAKLLKVDFNFQYTFISASNPFVVGKEAQPFSVPVDSLIKARYGYSDGRYRDYMVLRLKRVRDDLGDYALGLRNIDYNYLPSRAPIAVVQHPGGDFKKIATGNLRNTDGPRMFYSNLSTSGGSSGAGIVNKQGKLVGIHSEGGCGNPKLGNANRGWSVSTVKTILDAIKPK